MLTTMSQTLTGEHSSPEELLTALHEAGPTALAELLGDVDHLLTAVTTAPRAMFEVGPGQRGEFHNLLAKLHDTRKALESLETRAVVAFAEENTRERIERARAHAAQEDAGVPALDELEKQADACTARDYSMMTRRSKAASRTSLNSARRLVRSMPHMLHALGTGKVTEQAAHAAARATGPLDDLQRRLVDQALHEKLPALDGAGVDRWRDEVAAVIGELDPAGAAKRHQQARKHRHVTFTPGEHGMATVSAHLPAIDAKLAHKRLSLEAERRRAEGERQGHSALMADAFVDTLIGREGGMDPVVLEIGLMITERALFSPEHGDAAHIEGYGAVPAEAVRAQLRDALAEPEDPAQDPLGPDGAELRPMLRKVFTHPTTGEVVAVESRAREFPAAMRRFLTWRDIRCRGPFCNAAIRHADHIVPHSRGGATTLDNGQGLCGDCNLGKEEDSARVASLGDSSASGHRVAWTSHGGITRETTAAAVGPTIPGAAAADDGGGVEGTSSTSACSSEAFPTSITVRIPEELSVGTADTADPSEPRAAQRLAPAPRTPRKGRRDDDHRTPGRRRAGCREVGCRRAERPGSRRSGSRWPSPAEPAVHMRSGADRDIVTIGPAPGDGSSR